MSALFRFFDRSLTFKQLLWLIPILLTLHNVEEALTMPQWVATNLAAIKSHLSFDPGIEFTSTQLLVSLSLATVVPWGAAIFCVNGEKGSIKVALLILLQAIVFLNAIVPHLSWTVWMGEYNPGFITALLINLPFSLYFFRRAFREGYLVRKSAVAIFLAALPAYPAAAWSLHFLGEVIAKKLFLV
ncbi:MAG TPA: HXXEE domain-containing protein [Bacteroidota bacterium]|nr:HXXEE domain-containing protein [Bacteroidota bacterium]